MNDRPIDLDDELLCAYLDGELDEATLTRVEGALAQDSGARLRLERMRQADAKLQTALPLASAAPEDQLAARILNNTSPTPDTQSRAKHPRSALAIRNRNVAILGTLAAGLGGIVLGHFLTTALVSPAPGPTASLQSEPDAVLLAALDELPSGKDAHGGDRSVHMVLTFGASNGRYCRVFQWRANNQAAEGVACRQNDSWQVLAWDGTSTIDSGFHPAGASELIDGVMDRLGGGGALDEAKELQAMQKGWK